MSLVVEEKLLLRAEDLHSDVIPEKLVEPIEGEGIAEGMKIDVEAD
jgi:hypothetical protein